MPKGEQDTIWAYRRNDEQRWRGEPCVGGIPYVRRTPEVAASPQMLEALKVAHHMMRNTNVPSGDGAGLLPAFAWDHPAMVKVREAIAAAEGDPTPTDGRAFVEAPVRLELAEGPVGGWWSATDAPPAARVAFVRADVADGWRVALGVLAKAVLSNEAPSIADATEAAGEALAAAEGGEDG